MNAKTNIMISAGESSGEMHAASLISQAKKLNLNWHFFGLGGDHFQKAGGELLAHINETAVMGFTEVISSLGRILTIAKKLKQAMRERRPQALVLIDFPDFNFRLAKFAASLKIPVIYYTCPQVWAWRSGRLEFLRKYTNRRALLFEFEKKFYEERGLSADWVGHPIFDTLEDQADQKQLKISFGLNPEEKLIALLPGSRKSVARRLAPIIFQAASLMAKEDPNLNFIVAQADSLDADFFKADLAALNFAKKPQLIKGRSRQILAAADLALLASGTSSVEASILGTPHLVTYQTSALSWLLAKILVKVKYASIANILMGRELIPEYLQGQARPENLARKAQIILTDSRAMKDGLTLVRQALGGPGASEKVLKIINEEINGRPN